MVLSKRERSIVITTVVVVGGLGLYQYVVDPLVTRYSELRKQVETATLEKRQNDLLVRKAQVESRRWGELSRGALKSDAATADSQAYNSIGDWALNSGMSLASLKPEGQPQREKEFIRTTFRASGTGTMKQIGNFLYKIQTASIPVRVTDLQVNSKKEGTDDLVIQIGISTVYLAPDDKNPKSPAGPAAGRPNT
jgi:hypothetical protein